MNVKHICLITGLIVVAVAAGCVPTRTTVRGVVAYTSMRDGNSDLIFAQTEAISIP